MSAASPPVDTVGMNQIEPKRCTLRFAAEGHAEACPGRGCAFWEAGGAVVEGACVIERLGVDLGNGDLATYLLETRERLEQTRDLAEAEAQHREFARRLGRDM
jgi:hypothetical protein